MNNPLRLFEHFFQFLLSQQNTYLQNRYMFVWNQDRFTRIEHKHISVQEKNEFEIENF